MAQIGGYFCIHICFMQFGIVYYLLLYICNSHFELQILQVLADFLWNKMTLSLLMSSLTFMDEQYISFQEDAVGYDDLFATFLDICLFLLCSFLIVTWSLTIFNFTISDDGFVKRERLKSLYTSMLKNTNSYYFFFLSPLFFLFCFHFLVTLSHRKKHIL